MRRIDTRAAGYTLLEILLVLVIISISMALVVPVIGGGTSSVEANTTAKKVGSVLNRAKALAIREKTSFSVEFRDSTILIKTRKGIKEELPISKSINVIPPANAIIFLPSGGSNGGEYAITGRKGEEFRVKISSAGQVKIEKGSERSI